MSFLQQFESMLAKAADAALMNTSPSGGFGAYLQRNPSMAALFSIAVMSAHTALSAPVVQAPVVIPAPEPTPEPEQPQG